MTVDFLGNCLDLQTLLPMISLGLLFILITTDAYKRSYTTTIYILSVTISMNLLSFDSPRGAILVLMIGAMLSLSRSIVNHQKDSWIKR